MWTRTVISCMLVKNFGELPYIYMYESYNKASLTSPTFCGGTGTSGHSAIKNLETCHVTASLLTGSESFDGCGTNHSCHTSKLEPSSLRPISCDLTSCDEEQFDWSTCFQVEPMFCIAESPDVPIPLQNVSDARLQ